MFPVLAMLAIAFQATASEINFRTVGFGSNAKIKEGGAIVVRSESALNKYRTLMGNSGRKPAIDWAKEQMVAVHAVGVGYGGASLQVNRVSKRSSGIEVEASLMPASQPAVPTPGVVRVLKREGIYCLIVIPKSKGEVTLKVVDPPRNRDGKNGIGGLP